MCNVDFNDWYSVSKFMNHNFLVKVGRDLVGFTGAVLRLGYDLVCHILQKAYRCMNYKFSYKCTALNCVVCLYSR